MSKLDTKRVAMEIGAFSYEEIDAVSIRVESVLTDGELYWQDKARSWWNGGPISQLVAVMVEIFFIPSNRACRRRWSHGKVRIWVDGTEVT